MMQSYVVKVIVGGLAVLVLCFSGIQTALAWKMESASVTLNNTFTTPSFTSVTFRQTYDTVPLVFVLPTNQGGDPSALRIRNVTTTGFEITQVEPPGNDGPHVSMTVHYLAVEPGTHLLPDSTVIEAGSTSTTTVQHGTGVGGAEGWDTINFSASFTTTPAVLAHIQAMVNETSNPPATTSIPWLTTAVRNISSSSMQLALERSEVNDGGGGAVGSAETIGYLVIDSGLTGTFTDSSSATIAYETIRSGDTIQGWDNGCYTVSFAGSYSTTPLVIATENTHDGGDGGWMRRCSLSTASIGLTEDEDIDRDSERSHTTERAGIMLFSQAFDASFPDPTPIGYYALDETSWNGTAGEVIDGSGSGNNGVAVGSAQTVANGQVCRAGATVNDGDAINTSVDVNGAVGGRGTVTFWFRPNWTQSGGERNQARVIFDASIGSKYFKLAKLDNQNNTYPDNGARRRLALLFEDSADSDFVAYTSSEVSFVNGTWIHIAVTWNYPGDRFQIYVDGTLAANQSINTNGNIPNLDTLYLGDNRSSYNPYGVTTPANGTFDEVRIWNIVRSQADIQNDMNATHACVTLAHYAISHSGTGVNCQAEPVTITAHDVSHNPVTLSSFNTITLSTSTGLGDWALATGSGAFNNGAANDGAATYQFGAESQVVLSLKHTTPAASPGVNINVVDGAITEDSGEDAGLIFAPSGFRFTDGTNPVTIGTQVAGKESNVNPGAQTLYLQAIRTDTSTGACVGVFPNGSSVNVELASQCNNPTTCVAGQQVRITNNSITTAIASNPNTGVTSYTSVPLLFGANSQAQFSFNYTDVGQISLHARYNIPLGSGGASPDTMLGSSNQFVVRPNGFVLSNIVRTSDGFANPAATGPGDPWFIRAGDPFTVTVTAVNTLGNPTPNYGNEITPEGVQVTPNLIAPAGGDNPAIGNNTIAGIEFGATGAVVDPDGVATVTNLSWDAVGIITISPNVDDNDYLGGGNVTGTTSVNVGRFTPHHFDVTRAHGCTGGATFTYSGQSFTVTATARKQSGAIAVNYDGTAPAYAMQTTFSNAGDATNFANNVLAAADFVNGVGTRNNITYTFPVKETAPATLTLRGVDTDTVSSAGFIEETTEIRSGRVQIQNAFGSELLDLPMPMTVQYYVAGGFFGTNTADTCTDVTLGLGNWQGNLNLVAPPNEETCPQDTGLPGLSGIGCQAAAPVAEQFREGPSAGFNGNFNLYLRASGAGNDGSVDVTVNLDAVGSSPWLKYDWTGAGLSNPVGRATFGVYKGSDRHIYLREMY